MAASYDFALIQGATFKRTVLWKDANGGVIPLTNYTAKLQIRQGPGTTPLLTLTPGSGLTITANAGQVDIVLTAAQTAALVLPNGSARYDLLVSNTITLEATRLLVGGVTVDASITVGS